jgi:hypothetical protein
MAEHLGSIVRAATSAEAGVPWETALPCRRRPGNRQCPGHIAVFRPDVAGSIEWACAACDDQGVIGGWEDSLYDLRGQDPETNAATHDVGVTAEVWRTLRGVSLLDADCERLVYSARPAGEGVIFRTNSEDLESLLEYVASEANHEDDRRRQKRLDTAVDALERQLDKFESNADPVVGHSVGRPPLVLIKSGQTLRPAKSRLQGKWRIFEMDLWDEQAIDLVGAAYIEFGKDGRGELSFIAVRGGIDARSTTIDGKQAVEFTWQGFDEGDEVSGRGWAVREDDGSISGHLYFHLGDDSGFRARPW